uniref:Uncharacterized protein n=1 Tax=Anopheles atroparvus TaxID=41427 RepID=A0A182J6D1_ANOAO
MIRIAALNEEESDDSNGFDSELIVTKEAEETIAISEYVRALQMKKENKLQEALELLLELLDTQVINDVSTTQTDSKLFAVKYNCFRNIGLIYEEQGKENLAIEFLMKAMDLDETDVYTMSRLARMALKTGYLQIAKLYFEKCLKRNPNHWPSMEGLLKVFCSASNVVEAYGWAAQCHRKDSRNRLYVDVLRAIREKFKSTLPYLDTVFTVPLVMDFAEEEKRRPLTLAMATFDELFKPQQSSFETPGLTVMPDSLKELLKIDDLSFENIGNVLVKLNEAMEKLDLKCVFMLDTDTLFCEHQKEVPERMEEAAEKSPPVAECDAEAPSAKDDKKQMIVASPHQRTTMKLTEMGLPLPTAQIPVLSWGLPMKPELRAIYLKVHASFVEFTDYDAWNQLAEEQLELIFQITVFHLELKLDAGLMQSNDQTASIFDMFDEDVFHRCRFYVDSLANEKIITLYRIRLLWLAYILDCSLKKFDAALENLYLLQELVEAPNGARLELTFPNQRANTSVSSASIQELIGETERKLRIERVKRHYENGDHEQVVEILMDTLRYYTTMGNPNESILNLTIQMQMLLESQWSMAEMEACFIWSEKSFCYSVQQFVTAAVQHDSRLSRLWASNINFTLLYLESIIKQEGVAMFDLLDKHQARLIQTLHRLLTHQLDPSGEKNYTAQLCLIECWRAWIVLYYILERQDDMDSLVKVTRTPGIADPMGTFEVEPERLCNSIMMCFVAHELLGKKNWCSKGDSGLLFHILDVVVPKIRSPMLEPFREMLNEYLEQVTYCLYGYPQKRPRLRHIQDHNAAQVTLTWERAIQLFDLYRPDNLPEFNSYKLESISTDMEALLQRIIPLIPAEINITRLSRPISEFIDGKGNTLPESANILQGEIKPIFYLLADFYFKSRDFTRAIKYYVMDLTLEPSRFDSWAGISLSKASKVETKLNSTEVIPLQEFLDETDNGMKCFDQCLQLNEEDAQLWIEYGSFAYNIHSFCSRTLKLLSDTLSMESFALVETHKERCLDIAFTCFNKVSLGKMCFTEGHDGGGDERQESGHNHEDEIWLHHYMLGKIAEKKKEHPAVYLTHYLKSAKYLYECNATYPIKINHSSPSQLAIEALEIFYRINAAIVKYVEQHSPINKKTSRLFQRTLKELSTSPFAVNRAKINENMLKRKISPNAGGNGSNSNSGGVAGGGAMDVAVPSPKATKPGLDQPMGDGTSAAASPEAADTQKQLERTETPNVSEDVGQASSIHPVEPAIGEPMSIDDENALSPTQPPPGRAIEHLRVEEIKQLGDTLPTLRRGSQESAITTTTTTTTTTTSTSSSSSDSSDSDSDTSSDSDSDSTSTDDETVNQQPITAAERDTIFKQCIKNLEECITRFPEHYKSMYRLIHHFMHAPGMTKSFDNARQLLLGNYRTTLGNQIPGLFTERKSTNFFNGLWRIPASDIDRPGNFASHISKCVIVLMETLKEFGEHEILMDLALQLQRTPEPDKKYLNDYERKELVQQAILFCVQVYRSVLKKSADGQNDAELLSLMVDVYKTYRKITKHLQSKEPLFAGVLVDAYKAFVSDKVPKLPEHGLLDLAVKLCTYEINYRKTQEKQQNAGTGTGGAGGAGGPTGASGAAGAGNGANGAKQTMTSGELPATMIVPMQPISANFIPGLTKQNRRIGMTKTTAPATLHEQQQQSQQQQQQQLYPNPYSQFSQGTMGSMMADLSSRVTITPIMLDSAVGGSAMGKNPAATPMTTMPTASMQQSIVSRSSPFPSTTPTDILLPMPTGTVPASSVSPSPVSAGPAATSTSQQATLFQQYLKIFSQIPNIASLGSNPMMTAAMSEYIGMQAYRRMSMLGCLTTNFLLFEAPF